WRSSRVPGKLPEITLLKESDENWRWRPGETEASNPIDEWRTNNFEEDGSWSEATLPIGYGSVRGLDIATEISGMRNNFTSIFLRNRISIAPGEVPQQLQIRYSVDDGMILWINGVKCLSYNVDAGEQSVSSTASGNGQEGVWRESLVEGVSAYLKEGENLIAVQVFNTSPNSSDLGIDIEIIRPSRGENEPPRPSPGIINTTSTLETPPIMRQVEHSPRSPKSNEDTVISTKVTSDALINSVKLEYQIVSAGDYIPSHLAKTTNQLRSRPNDDRELNPAYHDPNNWTSINMKDDGLSSDVTAGDDIYTTKIPAQKNRTLVRYRIITQSGGSSELRIPYNDDNSLNFAYFVYDGVPDYVVQKSRTFQTPHTYSSELINSVPVYHVITDSDNFDQAVAYNSGDHISRDNYDARSAYNWNCTFVYDGKVYDNVGYRLRQRNARYSGNGRRSFKFKFNLGKYPKFHDNDGDKYKTEWKYLASHKMKGSRGNHTWGIEQAANHLLWNMTGTPAPYTHWFHMRVIREEEEAPSGANGQYQGDYYGMLLAMEEYDVRFLDSHGMEKGNLYKLISGRTDGVSVRRYLAKDGVDDGSDFKNIIFQLKPNKSDDWLNKYVNYDSWNRYHAIVDAVRHYDVQPNTSEHLKNRAFYFEPSLESNLGRLWVLPWDSDTSWGPNWNGGEGFCKQAIYDTNPPRPEFDIAYKNTVREIRDLIWTEEQINILLDPLGAKISGLVNADRDRWIGAVGGNESPPSLESVINDMKKFAFNGGSWVGGSDGTMDSISRDSGVSGRSGRDAYLDALSADSSIPRTPSIDYVGVDQFPQGELTFESSSFSDPNGSNSFGSIEWRIAEISNGETNFLPAGSLWRYLDNGKDLGTEWREVNYNDLEWLAGDTPAGFGSIINTPIVTTLDFGDQPANKHPTYYFRTSINIQDPNEFSYFTFNLHVDDAAIVYVNGNEIIRDGFRDDAIVNYNTYAPSNGKEGVFDTFEVEASAFSSGINIIAVELHNQSAGSSDLVFDMSISADASILSPKFEWLAEWESGEINRFDKQIIPPATAVRVGKTYRARVRHKDTTNRWSHWSPPLEFTVSDSDISNFSNLRISELMYNPIGPSESELEKHPSLRGSDFEWIEITNDGNEQVSIKDLRFTKGIEYNFSDSKLKIIKPGESLIIVANEDAFKLRYQFSETPYFVIGTFTKNFSNSGERIKLTYGAGTSVVDFEFKDQFPWPQNADGEGHSLVLVPHRTVSNHQDPKNWRISTYTGGTPGNNDTVIFSGDANGDANSNGISDLMEYATQGELEIETLLIEGKVYSSIGYISVIGADEVVTEIESSTDLNNWAVLNSESASISNQLLGNGLLKINIQDLLPLSKNSNPTFYRLRTTKR
ncbi:CotH kinase family protein, partial [Verrucomicrobiales bacterium]|nr:CotH kinase family protein [Verrucomicrobiales bacterium]